MGEEVAERLVSALGGAAERMGLSGNRPVLVLARRLGFEGYIVRCTGLDPDHEWSLRNVAQRYYEQELLTAAAELSAALSAGGIRHFFVKGIALAGSVYALGERDLADIDLYVPSESAPASQQVLERLGYRELEDREQSGPAALRPGVTLERRSGSSDLETVAVDLHWGIEPVQHLLPRAGVRVPEIVWDGLTQDGPLPAPRAEHHAALLVHHLVHHDLLHVRGLLDLALVCATLPSDGGGELETLARQLGVLRVARALHRVLVRDMGLDPLAAVGAPPQDWRGVRLARLLDLETWFAWAGSTEPPEHAAITWRRVRRRLLMLDRLVEARHLVGDALWPPRDFLQWRWPEVPSVSAARMRHLLRVAGKLISG